MVSDVLRNGRPRQTRNAVDTISRFGVLYRWDHYDGFPLLTTKRINWLHIVVETLWYLSGDRNLDLLHRHGIRYWDDWQKPNGEIPSLYGFWWRCFPRTDPGNFDQVAHILKEAIINPMSNRLVVSAWHPHEAAKASLPPCHVMWQISVRGDGTLALHLHQRSGDIAVGIPYNLGCYALLQCLLARFLGRKPSEFTHSIVDAHVYAGDATGRYDHRPGLIGQLSRPPRPVPTLTIDDSIRSLDDAIAAVREPSERLLELFRLEGYDPYPAIKFEVMV